MRSDTVKAGDARAPHRSLLRANWQRTLAWTARSGLALWMLTLTENPS